MPWVYKFDERALKELKKIDRKAQRKIILYLDEKVTKEQNPRLFGKSLKANLTGLWRRRQIANSNAFFESRSFIVDEAFNQK